MAEDSAAFAQDSAAFAKKVVTNLGKHKTVISNDEMSKKARTDDDTIVLLESKKTPQFCNVHITVHFAEGPSLIVRTHAMRIGYHSDVFREKIQDLWKSGQLEFEIDLPKELAAFKGISRGAAVRFFQLMECGRFSSTKKYLWMDDFTREYIELLHLFDYFMCTWYLDQERKDDQMKITTETPLIDAMLACMRFKLHPAVCCDVAMAILKKCKPDEIPFDIYKACQPYWQRVRAV